MKLATEPPSIIVADDDEEFTHELCAFLTDHGYRPVVASSMQELAAQLAASPPGIVLLDQFMHGRDAVLAIPEIRTSYAGGLIVLTGNVEPSDRIVALEMGADDFVLKTTPLRELVARMHAVGRRIADDQRGPVASQPPDPLAPVPPPTENPDYDPVLQVGAYALDTLRRTLIAPNGTTVRLTGHELLLLEALISNSPKLISRPDLTHYVYRRPFKPSNRGLDNLVCRVRAKLDDIGEPDVILSERNGGYRFCGFQAS